MSQPDPLSLTLAGRGSLRGVGRHGGPPPTVLVTGAAGFVGSHLCEYLVARGHPVVGIDDLSSGDIANLGMLTSHSRFRFIRHDVTLPLPAEAREATRIVNLACAASPAYQQRHAVAVSLASTLGTWRLLELAWSGGARLVQVSVPEGPGAENGSPRAAYIDGQRAAEAMCQAYVRERGVAVRTARLYNCYGPRMRPDDGRVVPSFVAQALAGRPLTVHGDGSQRRGFLHVSDAVAALVRLMDGDGSQPLDIGHPQSTSVLELAERVRAISGTDPTFDYEPPRSGSAAVRLADIEAARRRLAWQPRVTLDDGLRELLAHGGQRGGRRPRSPPAAAESRAIAESEPV